MRQIVDRSMQILVGVLVATVIGVAPPSFAQDRKNLAYDKSAQTIPPRLTEHSKKMEQRVYKIADNVYSAVGYALANSIMIEGRDGVIIVDVTEDRRSAFDRRIPVHGHGPRLRARSAKRRCAASRVLACAG